MMPQATQSHPRHDGDSAGRIIRVAIVEDDEKLRQALEAFIVRDAGFRCVSSHGSAEEALEQLPASRPDVVLMDIRLPGMSGIECVARLRALVPETKALILTAYEDSDEVFRSLRAGAFGYILKSTDPARLREAIRETHLGGSSISGSIARKIVDSFRPAPAGAGDADDQSGELSRREIEVLKLLATGLPYKLIAAELDVSINTIRVHIKRIYGKLHVHSRFEAVREFGNQKESQ